MLSISNHCGGRLENWYITVREPQHVSENCLHDLSGTNLSLNYMIFNKYQVRLFIYLIESNIHPLSTPQGKRSWSKYRENTGKGSMS